MDAIEVPAVGSSLSRTSSALTDLEDSQFSTVLNTNNGNAVDTTEDAPMEVDARPPNGDTSMSAVEDPNSYSARVARRLSLLKQSVAESPPLHTSYTFQPILGIPQSTVNTHALALPPCASHLYSSGSDGFIRRYAWYPVLRMRNRQPVLKSYWENPTIAALEVVPPSDVSKARFGPAGVSTLAGNTAPVHSLAVQRDELYCLAGSAEGVINLFTTRLDEGQCRASLGMDKSGHARGKPVSVLALNETDSTLLSGGWDSKLLQWDLNTGICSRRYEGHKAQLTCLQFRPESQAEAPTAPALREESEDISPSKAKVNKAEDEETKAEAESEKNVEAESENSYDPLFDDEGDGQDQTADVEAGVEPSSLDTMSAPSAGLSLPGLTLPAAPSSPGAQSKPAPNAPAAAKLPEVSRATLPSYSDGSLPQLGEDVFLSAALDGECLIWDRRASSGAVRRLNLPKASSPWCISATWSQDGTSVYVGRRDSAIDMYDLRTRKCSTVSLPKNSGSVSAISCLPQNRHVLLASGDTVRLWDPLKNTFTIASTIQSGCTSLNMDMRGKYLFAANGGKGLVENGLQEVVCFEVNGK